MIGSSKLYFIGSFPVVVPTQYARCLGWNALMLFIFVLFINITPVLLHSGILWNVFLALVALNVVLSIRTVFTDPGYIPPVNAKDEESGDGFGLQKPNPLVELVDPDYANDMFNLMYCRTCKHLRPKCSTHCKLCDVCVMHFDHHCTIVGACIGARNVGSFIAYLASVSLSAGYGTCLLVHSISLREEALSLSSPELYAYIAMFFCGGGSCVVVGTFAVYYGFLVLSGKSSKQFLTQSQQTGSFGITLMLKSLFAPQQSLLHLWKREEEAAAFLPTSQACA